MVLVFQKTCFKVKLLERSKSPVAVTEKHANLSNGGLFKKSQVQFFRGTYSLPVGFKRRSLQGNIFLSVDKNHLTFCCKIC